MASLTVPPAQLDQAREPSSPLYSPLAAHLRAARLADGAAPPQPARGLARRLLLARLGGLRRGRLHLWEGTRCTTLGTPAEDGLEAHLHVLDPALWSRLLLRGSLGGAESYRDGLWVADDLCAVVRLFARNHDALLRMDNGLSRLSQPVLRLASRLRRGSRAGARRNIAYHYDLSNEFFALWLDPTMTYSAGLFETPEASLEQASLAKLDALCRQLELRSSDHLLEIGSGWGSMALHAARHYGCHVTTTTISAQQHELASRRVREAGLEGRVQVLRQDYRDLRGSFDKLVSVEMIEAVGHAQFETFFANCARLLVPGGRAAIQAITIADQKYERARRQVDFIRRYIFPGSTIPSITRLCNCATAASDLRLVRLTDLTPHYARTLLEWRRNFYGSLPAARELGFDEPFLRLWEYYLGYCEGAFREHHIGSVQLLFQRPA